MRRRNPPRLRLRKQAGCAAIWTIIDGEKRISTGRPAEDIAGAEEALQNYLADKHEPSNERRADRLLIAEVLDLYLQQHVIPNVIRKDVPQYRITHLNEWWGDKCVIAIKRSTCQDYITWRTSLIKTTTRKDGTTTKRSVAVSTARKDLETLGTALRYYHAENPLDVLPIVTMPPKSAAREEWLTRRQVAALLRSARRNGLHHAARFILIAVYTGTRTTAILNLQWLPSTTGGWFDLERSVLYRRGRSTRQTAKRQPPARIHVRLLNHLRRWHRADTANGLRHVITYRGEPIEKLRRSWDRIRDEATREGIDFHFTRHTLRHTAATWLMQAGISVWEAASYLGMSPETLERVYGHHSPDFQASAARAVAPKSQYPNSPDITQTRIVKLGRK